MSTLHTALSITISLNKRSPCTYHLDIAVLTLIKRSKQRFPPSVRVLPHTIEVQLEAAPREELLPVNARGGGEGVHGDNGLAVHVRFPVYKSRHGGVTWWTIIE